MNVHGSHLLCTFSFVFLVSSFISEVSGIKCFQCNSMVDVDCPYIQPNQTSSVYYKPCTGDYKGKQPFCRKIEQKIFDRDDMVRIVRKCGYEKHDRMDCYTTSNDDHSETICQCFYDACNSAVPSSLNNFSLIILCSGLLVFHSVLGRKSQMKKEVFTL